MNKNIATTLILMSVCAGSFAATELPESATQVQAARVIVQNYVKVNGFDANATFSVLPGMTIWSIGELYETVYLGATREQIASAFREKNPHKFKRNSFTLLQIGGGLTPPSEDEVFNIDPLSAFKDVHGEGVRSALVEHLAEAQKISREAARNVAQAQHEWLEKRVSLDEVIDQSQASLSAQNAPLNVEPKIEETIPVAATIEKAPESVTEPKVEEKVATDNDQEADKNTSDNLLRYGLLGVLALLLLVWLLRRRGEEEKSEADEAQPQIVNLQKDIPPSSPEQLNALEKTVDVCIEKGSTAGALGAGMTAFEDNKQPWLEPESAPLSSEETGEGLSESMRAKLIEKCEMLEKVLRENEDAIQERATSTDSEDDLETMDPRSEKEKIFDRALASKFELAKSFAQYGANQEALELVDEVLRLSQGALREAAQSMREELKGKL